MIRNRNRNPLSPPPVDQLSPRKKWEQKYWKKIMKSKKLLDSLVAPYERRNLVMRAAVMDFLELGKRPQQISKELQISRQTISSIRKAVKENSYKSYRERGKTERKKKVWSHNTSQNKRRYLGHYRRTKYGKIYMPY